jgi:amino-acid N-acetyltransferase
MSYTIRPARTRDVPMISKLIDSNVESGRLLSKATVTLYEDVQEFCVAELVDDAPLDDPLGVDTVLAGCGALHVMWEDLAEIRTVAVVPTCQGLGMGHAIVAELLARARVLGVQRVFCLTFAVDFFARHGFQPISGTPVAAEVYSELLRSYDEGVAEFLDLERVKPNTLGNTRMLLRLLPDRRNEHRRYARDDTSPAGAPSAPGGRKDRAMWQDLAALTPPLIVCVAFIVGLVIFLRHQMGPKRDGTPSDRRRSGDDQS